MVEVDRKTKGQLTVYKKASIRSVFRQRILKAVAGGLEPALECKPIRMDPEVYEIRWSDVRIPIKRLVDDRLEDHACHYRLYYAEPRQSPQYFLGLHAHEKQVDGLTKEEIAAGQDAQITRAVEIYKQPECWGVPELLP